MRRLAKAPPAPFIDGRESVASRARANMRAKPEGAEILRSGNRLRRRAIALRHFPRPCAGSRKHPSDKVLVVPCHSLTPFIDGRKSVASRAHTNMHAKPEGAEILRSGKLPLCATGI